MAAPEFHLHIDLNAAGSLDVMAKTTQQFVHSKEEEENGFAWEQKGAEKRKQKSLRRGGTLFCIIGIGCASCRCRRRR
jgi:hypothetical protein